MPGPCPEALLNYAKTPDFITTRSVITCEPLDSSTAPISLPSGSVRGPNRKHLEKPALPHGCYLARALMHLRSFTVLLGEVTSKKRLRFWNFNTAASNHGCEVAKSLGCSGPQGGDEDRLFFAEMMGAVLLRASAASLANRSAFSRAVFSIIA